MKAALATIAVALALVSTARAEIWVDDGKRIPARRSLLEKADDITFYGTAFARARVWMLVGEPVVYCDVAIGFSQAVLPIASAHLQQPQVMDAVTLIGATLRLRLAMASQTYVDCDAGALGKVFIPTPADLRQDRPAVLSDPKQRGRYVSFNVPGSPSWDRLFYKLEGPQRTKQYLGADAAKALFARHANAKHELPLQGFTPVTMRENNHYDIELKLSAAGVRYLQLTKTLADVRAEQTRFEAAQRVREDQRRTQLARQRSTATPAQVGGTRVVGAGDPFWSLPASVATPSEAASRTQLATRIADTERQVATAGGRVAADAAQRRTRESVGDPAKLLRDRCARSRDAYSACIQRTCGRDPGPYWGSMLSSKMICSPNDHECDRRNRERQEAERLAEQRAQQEHAQKQQRWNSCATSARATCSAHGTPDVDACVQRGWDPP